MSITEGQIREGLARLAGRGDTVSRKKEETRRRIMASVTELLLDRSVRRINMEEIADRAGISRGTLYTYARSKEDLVVKALAEEQLEHRRPLPDATAPPRARLKAIIAESIACFERMRLLALVVRGDADLLRSLEHRPDVQEAFGGADDRQQRIEAIAEAFGEVTPERVHAAASLLGVIASVGPYLVESAPAFGLTPSELAENLASCLVDGIAWSSSSRASGWGDHVHERSGPRARQ